MLMQISKIVRKYSSTILDESCLVQLTLGLDWISPRRKFFQQGVSYMLQCNRLHSVIIFERNKDLMATKKLTLILFGSITFYSVSQEPSFTIHQIA